MYKYLCLIAVILTLVSCAPAGNEVPTVVSTQTSIAVATEPAGIRVEVNGAQILITEVKEGQYYATNVVKTQQEAEKDALAGQYQTAKDGYRFVQTTIKVMAGDSKDVYEWEIRLKDPQEKLYETAIRSSGIFAGGADNIAWIFIVPNEIKVFSLVFPGEITIDLQPLIQAEQSQN